MRAFSLEKREIYEVGGFRFDLAERTIERVDGISVDTLPEKTLQILALLIRQRGHLVEKGDILEQIWPDSFVEENNVDKRVSRLRQFLGKTESGGKFIETVRGHGYRFVGRVNVVEVSGTWLPETFRSPADDEHVRSGNGDHAETNGSGAYRVSDLKGIDEDSQKAVSRAENPTTNGLSGEIAVNSIAAETPKRNLAGIAQNNPVSSHRSRTRFTALKAYAGIALVVLAGIVLYSAVSWRNFGKSNGPADRGTKNEEAYQLYQQAENLSEGRIRKDMPVALDYLNQAVTLDPNYARAWAAKALLHRYLVTYAGADNTEQYKKSMDAVEKALAIDPNISEAHSSLCLNRFLYEYDFAGAESACKRALELDPDSSVGHKAYANFLYSRGRSDEAIAESKQAIELQPLSREHKQTYALALYYARRYEEEEIQWKRLLELNPTHGYIYTRLFINLAQQGKYDKAFEYLIKKLTSEDKQDNEIIERFRSAFAADGWRGVTMERIKHPELEGFTGPFDVACLYATIGDKDKAFEFLQKAYQEHNYRISVLQVEPQLDPLRDDARYADLVRRVESK
jgi:DNA-binding winged helix-turn-helix (wHTH) protein/tetratricopeptide (TPR) repeat protein